MLRPVAAGARARFSAARFHKRQAALPGRPQGLMTFDRLATGSFANAAGAGRLDHWLATPSRAPALIIVLDQFSRGLLASERVGDASSPEGSQMRSILMLSSHVALTRARQFCSFRVSRSDLSLASLPLFPKILITLQPNAPMHIAHVIVA